MKKVVLKDFIESVISKIETIFNIAIAIALLTSCGILLYTMGFDYITPVHTPTIVIHIINESLLAMIILEIVWTIMKFLKDKVFSAAPFLIIGIISAIRRLLYIEAQSSYDQHLSLGKLYEIGVTALAVLVLSIAYYVLSKSKQTEKE